MSRNDSPFVRKEKTQIVRAMEAIIGRPLFGDGLDPPSATAACGRRDAGDGIVPALKTF